LNQNSPQPPRNKMSHRAISRDNRLLPANERHRNVYTLTKGLRSTQHIPNLPNEKHAEAMLERLRREFHPLAQARGYTIPTLTEMCCCSDGIHHYKTTTTKTTSTGRAVTRTRKLYGRRRFRRMSNNVQGYNYGNGRGGKHEIHLRLRRPSSHTFYSYEHVAGVMIHELTHCEIGPHSADFYQLMDDIADQFNRYMEKGIVVDKQGFPLLQDQAHRLGGGGAGAGGGSARGVVRSGSSVTRNHGGAPTGSGRNITDGEMNNDNNDNANNNNNTSSLGEIVQERKRARQAAEAAAKRNQRKGHKLGTGGSSQSAAGKQLTLLPNGTLGKGAWKKLTPREAALRAAERRQQDSQWCLPCDEAGDILDLTSETSESETDDEDVFDITKQKDNINQSDTAQGTDLGGALNSTTITIIDSPSPPLSVASKDGVASHTASAHQANRNSDSSKKHSSSTSPSAADAQENSSARSKSELASSVEVITNNPWLNNSAPSTQTIHNSKPDSESVPVRSSLVTTSRTKPVAAVAVVDLTLDDDDETDNTQNVAVSSSRSSASVTTNSRRPARRRRREQTTPNGAVTVLQSWSCPACTFYNPSLLHLACKACGTPRVENDESKLLALQKKLTEKDAKKQEALSEQTAANLLRSDFIEEQKQLEHKKSEREFGGFNIYGAKKQGSRTLGHLT
jgi:hypothetical protein